MQTLGGRAPPSNGCCNGLVFEGAMEEWKAASFSERTAIAKERGDQNTKQESQDKCSRKCSLRREGLMGVGA